MSSLSHDHNPIDCHTANKNRRQVIQKLKNLVGSLDDCDRTGNEFGGRAQPPEWTRPLIVYPLTKERKASFDKIDRIPPWEKKRKSIQIMGGAVVKGCSCTKRNGLQADCEMSSCKGHPLCLTKPYPMCLSSGRAEVLVTPVEAERMLSQLGPPSYEPGPGQCGPGEGCHSDCVPCSATVKHICQWMPEWMNESQGNQGHGVTARGNPGGQGGHEPPQPVGKTDCDAKALSGQVWCCVAKSL